MADIPCEVSDELSFQTLVRSMPGALATVDARGRQQFVNPAFCRLVGWTEEELVGQVPPFRYWPPEEAVAIQEKMCGSLARCQAEPTGIVLRFLHAAGKRFFVRLQVTRMLDAAGGLQGWITSVEDLRQLAEVKALLHERELFIERVTYAVPEIIYIHDLRENKNIYTNRHIAEVLGFTPEQIHAMGSNVLPTVLHPDDLRRLPELFARWDDVRDGQVLESEYRLRLANGQYRWFLGRDTVFQRDENGKVVQLIGTTQDNSERKKAEEARSEAERHVRESERRYRLLADHATDMISRHSPAGVYRDASPACARLLGFSPNELIGRSAYELIHPADRDSIFRHNMQLIADKTPSTSQYRVRRKDGDYIWIETHAQPILDPHFNELIEILAVSRDVTDRRNVQEALQQSEELFRALVEKSSDGIALVDNDGRIRYLSPAAGDILGYEPHELVGTMASDLVISNDLAIFSEHAREALSVPGGSYSSQIRSRARDGSIRHLELIVTNHATDPAIFGSIVNFRNIGDRIALEEQLRQAQKMEAVGQLAGGIAHDFNNILTAIIGNVAVMADQSREGDPQRQMLIAIDKAARRASELTSRLLGYSRRTALHVEPVKLGRIVPEAIALLRPTFDPRIVFNLQIDADAWPVIADADLVSQVITNLCLNSRDAMPRGGRLTIETENCLIDDEYVKANVIAQPGHYVRLTVKDTGMGMSSEVRARVFEPFFTTKPTGVGTGLGLAMVYGIMKSHGGWVTCESDEGVGTAMHLFLPRCTAPVEDLAPVVVVETPRSFPAHGETVLLVDDEPAIRTLGRFVLERHGYRVLLAEDGIDAIETFREVASQVDLVILDLTMPRLSGQDTYKRLREINPLVRVLFSSGYSADQLGEVDDSVGFINKPYRPNDLLEAVRKRLQSGGG